MSVTKFEDMTTKERVVLVMSRLPHDATLAEAMYRLELLENIEQGLAEAEQGLGMDHDEFFDQLMNEDAKNQTTVATPSAKRPSRNKGIHRAKRPKNGGKLHKTA